MREFSPFEKKVLQIFVKLYKEDRFCKHNVLYELFGENVYVIHKPKDGTRLYYSDEYNLSDIKQKLISIYFLYSHLQKNDLIIGTDISVDFPIIHVKECLNIFEFSSLYLHFYWIDQIMHEKIFISQTIIDYVDNDFKTTEELRFKKQYRCTVLSIVIAFVVGVLSIIFGVMSLYRDSKIDRKQFDSLKHFIESLAPLQTIDASINNDTLNVNVINENLIDSNSGKKESAK